MQTDGSSPDSFSNKRISSQDIRYMQTDGSFCSFQKMFFFFFFFFVPSMSLYTSVNSRSCMSDDCSDLPAFANRKISVRKEKI